MTKPELQRKISIILKHENIDRKEYTGAKQGLEKALEILDSNRKDLYGLSVLETEQARAIAKFAVDFNNLRHNGDFFVELGKAIIKKNYESNRPFQGNN